MANVTCGTGVPRFQDLIPRRCAVTGCWNCAAGLQKSLKILQMRQIAESAGHAVAAQALVGAPAEGLVDLAGAAAAGEALPVQRAGNAEACVILRTGIATAWRIDW